MHKPKKYKVPNKPPNLISNYESQKKKKYIFQRFSTLISALTAKTKTKKKNTTYKLMKRQSTYFATHLNAGYYTWTHFIYGLLILGLKCWVILQPHDNQTEFSATFIRIILGCSSFLTSEDSYPFCVGVSF